MKITTFVAALFVAASAFAGQTVYHNYDAALRGIALDNACITSSEVRTIKPVRTCTELVPVQHGDHPDNAWTDWVCQKYETIHLAYPRAFETQTCLEYVNNEAYSGCVSFGVKSDFLPATIDVRVVTENGEFSDYPGVQTTHTFPSCK